MHVKGIEARHDFASKLRQTSMFGSVEHYVTWQRNVRNAATRGQPPPAMPPECSPLSINLDLTTACNYACTHCIDWDMLNSRAKYDHEKLLASLDRLHTRGLRSVILIGGGEPTLYPKFGEIVRFLKTRNIQVGIVSNGSRGDKILDVAPVLTHKDWVRYSLDSGTTTTFTTMHRPKKPISLETICGGVRSIREVSPHVGVGYSYIIVWGGAERDAGTAVIPNITEMVAAAKRARESGFTYISYKPFLTRHPEGAEVMDTAVVKKFDQTLEQIREAIAKAKMLECDTFKVIESTNLRVLLDGTWREYTRQPKMCHMMAFRQVLSPLGLYNCPAHRAEDKARIAGPTAYSNGEIVPHTTAMLDGFNATHECREVTCLYNSANHLIEQMIDGAEVTPLPDREDYFL